jgi:FAD synthetase
VERADIYVRNLEEAFNSLRHLDSDERVREVVELARAYLRDSKYYLSRGDVLTSVATSAYAEGLLDALRLLGYIDFQWHRPSEVEKNYKKVLIAGTFEILHPGHVYYMEQAWRLGRVTAVISRDVNAARIKGRNVIIPAENRARVVSSIYYVHKARLGYEDDMLRVVEEERPDVILLGSNQPFKEAELQEKLRRRGLETQVLRASPYDCELCSTSKIIGRILNELCPREL